LTNFHTLINLTDWDDKVYREFVYYIGHHTNEDDKRRILEIRELDIERAEFDSPSDLAIGRWGALEPHRVPVG
jgi:hypothetical protein